MADGVKTDGKKAEGRGMRILLILSLALNLLVLGLVVGAMWRGHGMRGHGVAGRDGFGLLAMSLPREDRRALRDRFDVATGNRGGDRSAMRADFVELADLLRAESWDADGAALVLARQGARGAERMAAGQKIMLDYMAGLTPEARRALADRIEQGVKGAAGD